MTGSSALERLARAPSPASSTAAAARHRRGRRSAGAWSPRDRAPRPSRDRRPRGVRGSGASAAGRGRGGSAASVRSGRRPRVVAEGHQAARAGQGDDRRRGPLAEAAQVLAETGLDRPGGPALEPLDEPADDPEGVLEGEPRIALAELGPGLRPDVSRRDAQCGGPARPGAEPAGRQDRVDEGEPEGGQDGRGAQVALDPLEDRAEADELASGVQVEQLVGQALRTGDLREPVEQGRAHRLGADVGRGAAQVVGVERRLALLGPAALVAADRAAVVPADRSHPTGDAHVVVDRPDDLVGDEHPVARRAARREQVADRDLEARIAARRGGQPLERGVEMADVGRPQDDLGEHPGQRARLEGDGPALAVDGRPGDPAAAAEQVGHDVAGAAVELDPGGHDRGRRGRRDPVEDGQ